MCPAKASFVNRILSVSELYERILWHVVWFAISCSRDIIKMDKTRTFVTVLAKKSPQEISKVLQNSEKISK